MGSGWRRIARGSALRQSRRSSTIRVEVLAPTGADDTDLRRDSWSIALDQRAFGPRRILVAFGERSGRFLRLAHTARIEGVLGALACCVDCAGQGADIAVVFCDEPVAEGPPTSDLGTRFAEARAVCAAFGIHLVDWFSCDDQLFRSARMALEPDTEWWSVP